MAKPTASLPDTGLGHEKLRLLEAYYQRREAEDEARRDYQAAAARLREIDAEMRLRSAVAAEAAKAKPKEQS